MRVWLPDRAGALGQLATLVGGVGAEIIGIDILERGSGLAVDEIAVDVSDAAMIGALVSAISAADGFDVEEVRPVDGGAHDPRSDALDTAAMLVGARDRTNLVDAMVSHGRRLLGGTWAAVVQMDDGEVVAGEGSVPNAGWLVAFVAGSRSSARVSAGEAGPDDVVWAPLPATGLAFVVGRDGAGFRARERRQVSSLARIADTRLVDFCRRSHPSSLA